MARLARLSAALLLGAGTYPLYAFVLGLGDPRSMISCGIATLGCMFALLVPVPGLSGPSTDKPRPPKR